MKTIQINPLWIEFGAPALAAGLLLGVLIPWLIARSRQRRLANDIRLLETRIKDQDALQARKGFSLRRGHDQARNAFSELANQSLKSNSETFLRLAEAEPRRASGTRETRTGRS